MYWICILTGHDFIDFFVSILRSGSRRVLYLHIFIYFFFYKIETNINNQNQH